MLKGPKRSFVVVLVGSGKSWAKNIPNGTKNVCNENCFKLYRNSLVQSDKIIALYIHDHGLERHIVVLHCFVCSFMVLYGLFSRSYIQIHLVLFIKGRTRNHNNYDWETIDLINTWKRLIYFDKIVQLGRTFTSAHLSCMYLVQVNTKYFKEWFFYLPLKYKSVKKLKTIFSSVGRLHDISYMSSADSYLQKMSPVSKDLLLYWKKRPLYGLWAFFSYVENESGALLGRFDKKISFNSTAEVISLGPNGQC